MSKFDVEAAYGRIVAAFEKLRNEIGFEDPASVLPWMREAIERELRAAVLAGREEAAVFIRVTEGDRPIGTSVVAWIRTMPDP